MDTLLENGQHKPSDFGLTQRITGKELLLQRAYISLVVPKGSFPYNKELGSKLHTLSKSATPETSRLAAEYARQALVGLPEVQLEEVVCSSPQPDVLKLDIIIKIGREKHTMEVSI